MPLAAADLPGPGAEAGAAWKLLLEDACREALREVARGVGAGSALAVEDLVRQVAGRAAETAAGRGLGLHPLGRPGEAPPGCPGDGRPARVATPLLQDIDAVPWALWRERREGAGPPTRQWCRLASAGAGTADLLKVDPAEETTASIDSVETRASFVSAQASSASLDAAEDEDEEEEEEEEEEQLQFHVPPPPVVAGALPASLQSRSHSALLRSAGIGEDCVLARGGLTLPACSADTLAMEWHQRPRTVLIVAKPGDHIVREALRDMVAWLSSNGIVVVLEPRVLEEHRCLEGSAGLLRTFSPADCLERSIDLVVTIGGDGTLTWAVSLFKGAMPPVLSFAAGSLGFLTPFSLKDWSGTLRELLDSRMTSLPPTLVCRMRLWVNVYRRNMACVDESVQVQCLNEVLVHRGSSGALAKLDVSVDGERITLVQGDGLILATPTGSTAYSLAAGGSMVHPAVPAILLTPVSPHSLSFRPAILPASCSIAVRVPLTARCPAALSVDGVDICQLGLGDSAEVSASRYPVPTICRTSETSDWFGTVNQALQWNGRTEQKG